LDSQKTAKLVAFNSCGTKYGNII